MRKNLLFLTLCMLGLVVVSKAQNSLNFDGTNDVVQTNYSGVTGSADRTFEAWIYVSPNAPSSNLCILDYGLNAVGSRNTFMVSAARGLTFIAGGTNTNIGSTAGIITSGQWLHVAFVLDRGTGFLYLNGIQVGTGNLTNVNTPTGSGDLRIGQRVPGGSVPFSGSIDEVRVWTNARSSAQILANMNAELCKYRVPLAAYFKFNQGLASGNNTGLTSVVGEVGNSATANGFSMLGGNSNWVAGAPISIGNPLDLTVSIDTNLTLSANDTSSMTKYQWYDCQSSSILVGDTGRTYFSSTGGSFAVIVSNGNCSDTSLCVNVIRVGIEESDIENKFYLSQNPIENSFQLINKSRELINASLRSVTGRFVESKLNTNQLGIDFNISGAAPGLYILTVEGKEGLITNFKVIKR